MVCDENASKWNAPKWNRAKVGHAKLGHVKLARAKLNAPNWHVIQIAARQAIFNDCMPTRQCLLVSSGNGLRCSVDNDKQRCNKYLICLLN